MSDPVTNVDIDDVLTSIRRLVSHDEKRADPANSTPKAEVAPAEPEAAAERFVLTPALRIAEDEDQDQRDSDAADIAEAPMVELNEGDEAVQVHAELTSFEAAPETPAAERSEGQERDEERASVHLAYSAQEGEIVETAPEEIEAEAPSVAVDHGLKSRIAAWEAAVAQSAAEDYEQDYDPEPDEVQGFEPALSRSVEWDEASDELPEPEIAEEPANIDLSALASSLAAAQEEQEEAAAPEEEANFAGTQDFTDVVDEAFLREMVSDIVRQELQGALGERITRNVRKLVRREIHRALAAHDLD